MTDYPKHRLHSADDPLSGIISQSHSATDINPSALACPQSTHHRDNAISYPPCAVATSQSVSPEVSVGGSRGTNAFHSERPLNVQPAAAGGVAIDGRADLPLGEANMKDKIVGKAEKVLGKVFGKPELHEKGELRETGGKAAAHGLARAEHD